MIRSKLRHLRISPRKVRLAANLIKGMSVSEAEQQLSFLNKRAAKPLLKLLKSAVANAKNSYQAEKESLYIANITVDSGPTLKRMMPRAMGRADILKKKTSHITLDLEIKSGAVVKKKKEKPKVEEIRKGTGLIPQERAKESLRLVGGTEIKDKEAADKPKPAPPAKPYPTTSKSKKKFFSRQTFGNAKKFFRRKSI